MMTVGFVAQPGGGKWGGCGDAAVVYTQLRSLKVESGHAGRGSALKVDSIEI